MSHPICKVFSCINVLKVLPSKFCDICEFNYEIHKYATRFATAIHFPKDRTLAFLHNIRFSGPKLWNEFPDSINKSPSLNNFSLKLKQHFLSRYCS